MTALGWHLYSYNFWLSSIILGIASGRCGWLMHEYGHNSMTGHIEIEKWFQIAFMGIGTGMSASWWNSQHNRHHATPQKLQHDSDLDTLPLVAFNKSCIPENPSYFLKMWLSTKIYISYTKLQFG